MGIFYIDTEYTNGNFYLGDIFEIACLSEDSGYIYHSYINIECTIPNYVKRLCNVSDEKIKSSPSFYEVMNGVIEFINAQESQPPIKIISHGGYLFDFPLLFTNCMRNRFDYTWFEKCEFIDSVKELQQLGYRKPGLDSFAPPDRIHSAARDVELLGEISNKLLRSQNLNIYLRRYYAVYTHQDADLDCRTASSSKYKNFPIPGSIIIQTMCCKYGIEYEASREDSKILF